MLNEPMLEVLLEESSDLHADAMRDTRPSVARLEEWRRDVGTSLPTTEQVSAMSTARAEASSSLAKSLAAAGLLTGGIAAVLLGVVASPAAADKPLDIQILQTATSLELLAIAAYEAALGLPFIADGNAVVKKFAETTKSQHMQHREAFAAQTKALGGTPQTEPNAKYLAIVEMEKPKLLTPADVVKLAATLEEVATDTYLKNLSLLTDKDSIELTASIMGVECQHLATLRAVGALLAGGDEGIALIAIPTDVAKLPAAAGSVATPKPFEEPDMASPPAEGAVK